MKALELCNLGMFQVTNWRSCLL